MSVDLDVDAWADAEPAVERDPLDRLTDLEAAVAALTEALAAVAKEKEPPPLRFATLTEFVADLATWYRRDFRYGSEYLWCPEWWQHPEVVFRLENAWRAFESLRHDAATGLSVWTRDHLDPAMAKITAPGGPFGSCSITEGHRDPLPPIKVTDPPAGWWTPADSGVTKPSA